MTISAMTISATLRVLEKGALKTATPRFRAWSSAIWLVPMQNAPTAINESAASRTFFVTCVLLRMPRRWMPLSRSQSCSSLRAPWARWTSKPLASRRPSATG